MVLILKRLDHIYVLRAATLTADTHERVHRTCTLTGSEFDASSRRYGRRRTRHAHLIGVPKAAI